MTPKEKANELVQKYARLDHGLDEEKWKQIEVRYDGHHKQCALICIDEILEANEKISLKDLRETMQTNDILCQLTDNAMYWQEVKQEIEKL